MYIYFCVFFIFPKFGVVSICNKSKDFVLILHWNSVFFFKRCWESLGVAVIFFKILNSPPKRSRAQPVARRKIENTTGQQCPKLLHLGEWKMGVYGSYKDSFGFLKLFHSISFKTWPCESSSMKTETATGHAAVGS